MSRTLENLVGGTWQGVAGPVSEVRDPGNGEVLAHHPSSSPADVDQVVAAARSAFPAWKATPVPERARTLFRYHRALTDAESELAELIVRENGKTLPEARGELLRAFQYVEHACAVPELQKGAFTENVGTGVDSQFVREPLGVFAVVAPFNFPAMIPLYFTWAVACGNTVVVKPSELCPLTTIRMAELASEAGFPDGVVNVVLGGAEVVGALAEHPDVVGMSFVGSSAIAEAVYKLVTGQGKRAQCQGGAKNHLVVAGDAQLDRCLPNLVNSMLGNASQRCFAGSNVLVESRVYDDFLARFLEAAAAIRVGYGLDPEVTMGPVITSRALEGMHRAVEAAESAGATVLLDGRQVQVDGYPDGHYLGPTILAAEPGMAIFDDELFGPVRCVKRVESVAEALDIINRSRYGHTAAIYTADGHTARDFARQADVGQVGINVGTPAPIAFYPVGGRRTSFYGSHRGRANDAVDFYTDKKVIVSTWFAT